MSRPVPTLRRKEIIYKKSFVDTHNQNVDHAFGKPVTVLRRHPEHQERPASVIIRETIIPESNSYGRSGKAPVVYIVKDHPESSSVAPATPYDYSPKHISLAQINSKLDEVLKQLENKAPKRSDEILKGSQEKEQPKNVSQKNKVDELTETVEKLSKEHSQLKEKLRSSNFVGEDSVNEILKVINDTRMDIEEKISNLKQLSDGTWIHLDDKIDSFERTQNGIQVQICELMKILTSLNTNSSRSSSSIGRTLRSRSDSTLVETVYSSNKKKETVILPDSANNEKTTHDSKSKTKPKPLEKQKSIEVLHRSDDLEFVPIWQSVETPDSSDATSSMIAPLHIDERRASHVANVFSTNKQKSNSFTQKKMESQIQHSVRKSINEAKKTMISKILSSRNKWAICDRTLFPIYYLLLLLGLNQSIRPNFSLAFRFYSWFVFVLLLFTTARKFNQIGLTSEGNRETLEQFFANPLSLITLCNALMMMSGLLASSLLYTLGGKRLNPLKVLCKLSITHRTPEAEKRQFIFNTFLAVFSGGLALIMAATYALAKWGYIMKSMGTPNLSSETIFCVLLDSYALFISRAAISALAILFYQHCSVIRRSIKHLIKEMVPEDQDECPLPESSLKKIHDVQVIYQKIYMGKSVIEDYYSFALFYAYGVCIPIFCFLIFAIMTATHICWTEVVSVIIWIINAVLVLLLFSVPAFMIHEDGERLMSASFRMYHETFHEERDLTVLSQMTFFTFQIHSTKLTLSASNYFDMNRSIILSLFSAILTYFLILWEFDIKNKGHNGTNGSILVNNVTTFF